MDGNFPLPEDDHINDNEPVVIEEFWTQDLPDQSDPRELLRALYTAREMGYGLDVDLVQTVIDNAPATNRHYLTSLLINRSRDPPAPMFHQVPSDFYRWIWARGMTMRRTRNLVSLNNFTPESHVASPYGLGLESALFLASNPPPALVVDVQAGSNTMGFANNVFDILEMAGVDGLRTVVPTIDPTMQHPYGDTIQAVRQNAPYDFIYLPLTLTDTLQFRDEGRGIIQSWANMLTENGRLVLDVMPVEAEHVYSSFCRQRREVYDSEPEIYLYSFCRDYTHSREEVRNRITSLLGGLGLYVAGMQPAFGATTTNIDVSEQFHQFVEALQPPAGFGTRTGTVGNIYWDLFTGGIQRNLVEVFGGEPLQGWSSVVQSGSWHVIVERIPPPAQMNDDPFLRSDAPSAPSDAPSPPGEAPLPLGDSVPALAGSLPSLSDDSGDFTSARSNFSAPAQSDSD